MPLAGAYTVNALWSLAAQTNFALTPILLPMATGFATTAHLRLQGDVTVTGWEHVTVVSTGLLLGWTAVASTVNFAAGALLLGADKTAPGVVAASTAGLTAASGLLTAATAASRGYVSVAAASRWGLFTTAPTSRRPRSVRLAAAAGGVAITAAGAWRRHRR